MEIIKTAIVGMGVSAKTFHLPFLLLMPEYKIVSVLERHGNTANQLLPQAQVVRTMEELLNTNIDLVIITTPNETHFSYAQQSLLAGKHVVVEKPFTITLEEAK
jgi:predicted dehydrogenase